MNNFLTINLLPYKEVEKEAKKKQFSILMVFSALVGVGLIALIYFILLGIEASHESRNQLLSNEISVLDKQIVEVKTLQAKRNEFLARKQKIEELENERYRTAIMLNTLNKVMPEGAYLTEIQSSGDVYNMKGYVVSDDKVSLLMKSLPSTGEFDVPELLEISSKDGKQSFSIKTSKVIKEIAN